MRICRDCTTKLPAAGNTSFFFGMATGVGDFHDAPFFHLEHKRCRQEHESWLLASKSSQRRFLDRTSSQHSIYVRIPHVHSEKPDMQLHFSLSMISFNTGLLPSSKQKH